MKKLMTRTEFIQVMDLLNYEGYFTVSSLLSVELDEYFNNDFVHAVVIDANNKMLILRKREINSFTYEVYSIK